jgi:glucan phosphoethanolaminetransferase (alkaline phosphatase superfamily)
MEARMTRRVRYRFWVELVGTIASLFLTILTIVNKEWIEVLFNVDPDAGSGLLEWAIVLLAGGLTVLFSVALRAEWRRTASART